MNSYNVGSSCTDQVQTIDDTKTIADLYYNKKKKWINSLFIRKEVSDFDQENGRMVQNIAIKMNESSKKKIRAENYLEFEEILRVEHLRELKKKFYDFIKLKSKNILIEDYLFDPKKKKQTESLNEEEFLDVLKTMPFYGEFEFELKKLYHRIDHENVGSITWTDVSNYFTIRLQENQYSELLKTKMLNIKPKIKLCEHNKREVTVKVLKIENPLRFVNISRRGAVGIWSTNFNLIKTFQIEMQANCLSNQIMGRKSKNTMWIKDVVLLSGTNKFCIATTKRDLRFFFLSNEKMTEEFAILNLPLEPTCLEYYYDKEKCKSYLFIGDDLGKINILTFHKPNISFFDKTKVRNFDNIIDFVPEIRWQLNRNERFFNHEQFIEFSSILVSNGNMIESIKFIPFNRTLVISTTSYNKSLIILDPESKKKEYNFSLYDICSCFDICMPMHILATASNRSPIYLWDIYSPNKPISKIQITGRKVISLKFHYPIGYLYSLTSNSTIEVWDIKDDHLVQRVEIQFPIMDLIFLQYAPFTMSLFEDNTENNLIITCKDYIAKLQIGENIKISISVPLSCNSPINCMAYSPIFKMIITCCEDSTITFWNLVNGRKIFTITNAHDKEEVTKCVLNNSGRILFTGAINGKIKAWNVANGNMIQSFETKSDFEITELALMDRKRLMIVVGTNKKIISFIDLKFESLEPAPPNHLYGGINQHEDEILCCDWFNNLLATGGSEGTIKIWSIDTKRLFLVLRDNKDNSDQNLVVYKLLFLKKNSNLSSTILISSESGYLSFWKLTFKKEDRLLKRFYACSKSNELVLSLATNSDESILITGDTIGFITLWDIEKNILDSEVKCLKTWKCHDSAIVSIKFIQKLDYEMNSDLLITASNDWCCRVWTLAGDYIGSFGQETRWNLTDEKTFASFESECPEVINEDTSNEIVKFSHEKSSSNISNLVQNVSKFDYLDSLKYFKKFKKVKDSYLPDLITYDVDKMNLDDPNLELTTRHSSTSYSRLRMHTLSIK